MSSATTRPPPAHQRSRAWAHRHLTGLQGLGAEEIRFLLRAARAMAEARPAERSDLLHGRAIANLFFEDSTRTRLSFSLAAKRLGAEVVDLAGAGSSVSKGETLLDTARTVAAMGVQALVIRHNASGAAEAVARDEQSGGRVSVLNAGDGRHEHPSQGLLDALTLAEAFDRLETFDLTGLRFAIVGDIVHSRVARSDIAALTALGASIVCVGPPTFAPDSLRALGVEVERDLDAVLPEVDGVQSLRIQFERAASVSTPRDYAAGYQLNAERAGRMRPHAVVLHPGPFNRGIEITGEIADREQGPRSLILRQVANGVPVRMACLAACLGALPT